MKIKCHMFWAYFYEVLVRAKCNVWSPKYLIFKERGVADDGTPP